MTALAARKVYPAAAVLVILAHASPLVSIQWTTKPKSMPPVPTMPMPREPRLIGTQAGSDGLACPGTYIGIGVKHMGGLITEVAPGGPAEAAGIRVGDIFADSRSYQLMTRGTTVVVPIFRQGVRLELSAVVDVICVEE